MKGIGRGPIVAGVLLAATMGRHWAVTLALAALFLSTWVARRLHWSVGLALFGSIASSLWTWSIFGNHLHPFDLKSGAIFFDRAQSSAAALSSLLLVGIPILLMRTRQLSALGEGMALVCLTDSAYVIIQWVLGWTAAPGGYGGFFANPSMNGCFIAVTYAALLRCLRPHPLSVPVAALPLLAIVLSQASMPLGVLFLMGFVYMMSTGLWTVAASVAGVLFSVGLALATPDFFSSSGRFQLWELALNWWAHHANLFFGVGLGTTPAWLPQVHQAAVPGVLPFWAVHNDWLQVLFEQGLFGLLTLGILFFSTLKRAWDRPALASSVAGYGACALGNFPLHMPVHAFLGAYLVVSAFHKRGTQ